MLITEAVPGNSIEDGVNIGKGVLILRRIVAWTAQFHNSYSSEASDKSALEAMSKYQEFNFSSWLKNLDDKKTNAPTDETNKNDYAEFDNKKKYTLIQTSAQLEVLIEEIKKINPNLEDWDLLLIE